MEILNTGKKILVIQTAFLGDAILTLPMIQKLKEKYNDSMIDVLCIPATSEIFYHSPYVNEVIVYDKKGKQKSLIHLIKLVRKIRNAKYTKIYSPHRSFRTAIIILFSKVKETYGFDNSSLSFVYKYKVHYNKKKHEVERNLNLIGYDTEKNSWRIFPELIFKNEISQKFNNIISDKKLAAVAPGSVWKTKIYPKEYYKVIIKFLIDTGYFVLLIGGEQDKDLCQEFYMEFKNSSYSFAGMLSPVETISLLKKTSLLICNDSAPTHMGMAARIPTLTIFCSTVPEFGFYPYNPMSDFISYDNLKCKPCGIHGYKNCPIRTFDCGYLLKPEYIIEKLRVMINRRK
ncbi:MAG: glycosyltransferase family 9 protein [Melioribacter sp.]|nr:glycosyltransferase family 9 protein [Melioribacter sp.]